MQYILEQGVCHGTVFNSCHTSSTAEKNPLTEIQEGEDEQGSLLEGAEPAASGAGRHLQHPAGAGPHLQPVRDRSHEYRVRLRPEG